MKKYYLLVSFLSFFFFRLNSEMTRYSLWLSPTGQAIFLFDHAEPPRGKSGAPQVDALIQRIKEYEMGTDLRKLILYLEHPVSAFLSHDDALKDINHCLFQRTGHLNLERTKIFDGDIRRLSSAAALLIYSYPEYRIRIKDQLMHDTEYRLNVLKKTGCQLDKVTFEDVWRNYAELFHQCEFYRDSFENEVVKEQFNQLLNETHEEFSRYQDFIYSLPQTIPILEFGLGNLSTQFRRDIDYILTNLFYRFLDMHILYKIFTFQNNADIGTIAFFGGSAHTGHIRCALHRCGYKKLHHYSHQPESNRYSANGYSGEPDPLPAEVFHLIGLNAEELTDRFTSKCTIQ